MVRCSYQWLNQQLQLLAKKHVSNIQPSNEFSSKDTVTIPPLFFLVLNDKRKPIISQLFAGYRHGYFLSAGMNAAIALYSPRGSAAVTNSGIFGS